MQNSNIQNSMMKIVRICQYFILHFSPTATFIIIHANVYVAINWEQRVVLSDGIRFVRNSFPNFSFPEQGSCKKVEEYLIAKFLAKGNPT